MNFTEVKIAADGVANSIPDAIDRLARRELAELECEDYPGTKDGVLSKGYVPSHFANRLDNYRSMLALGIALGLAASMNGDLESLEGIVT